MTLAPLPMWSQLRALRGPLPGNAALVAPWMKKGEIGGLLSRSTWSLALIAEWRRRMAPERPVTIWLPAFFCNSALVALRALGARFVFYPVDDALEPDLASFPTVEAGAPDLVVAVHYFGRPSPTSALHDFCTRHKAWLVEDAAHVLGPVAGIGTHGDFVIYSPHKHLALPDGAVLVARPNGSGRIGDGLAALGDPLTWAAQLGPLQQRFAGRLVNADAQARRWLMKRVAQMLGVGRRAAIQPFAEPITADASPQLTSPTCSDLARRLLGSQTGDLGARARQRHLLLWDAALTSEPAAQDVAPAARPTLRSWIPYLAAYTSTSADQVYDRWRRRGLPVTTWPDLPPEVKRDQTAYAHAWRLRHSRIYLPVHPSLSAARIARLAPAAAPMDADVSVAWDAADADQWRRWSTAAGQSNLLQDWAYGIAKAEETGWRLRRIVFSRRGAEPLAIAQLLERRVAGVLTLRRLNRGPMFVGPASDEARAAVWRATAALGGARTGTVMSITPEAEMSGAALTTLLRLGFRPSGRAQPWESVWLDLSPGLDALRRSLHKEWRNALSASERAGLVAEISTTDESFDWLMVQYRELMAEKHFVGPSIPLLRSLRRHAADGHLFVVRALKESQPIAGILVGRHGDAATYMLGCNGPLGRTNKANHFLLWQALGELRRAGVGWFDLGGLSEAHTPGITAFKLGMGGERYELVGDFLCW